MQPAPPPPPAPDDFTLLLNRAAGGDGLATNAVWSRAYEELLAMARGIRPAVDSSSAHAPSPTTIIHESFMKTFGPGTVANRGDRPTWDSRAHFFGSVARAMSQFVIDWRRASRRRKRGGGERPVSFDDSLRTAEPVRGAPAELDEFFVDAAPAVVAALANLQTRAPEIADVVWLRCVAGLSLEDTAVVLGIRPRTVSKRWNLGRALLRRDLARLDPSDGDARDAAPR